MRNVECIRAILAAAYVVGELDGAAEQSFEKHSMDCDECLCAVELWQALEGIRGTTIHESRAVDGGAVHLSRITSVRR